MKPTRRKLFRTSIEIVHEGQFPINISLPPGSRSIEFTQKEILEVANNRFGGFLRWFKKAVNFGFQHFAKIATTVIGGLILAYLLAKLGLLPP